MFHHQEILPDCGTQKTDSQNKTDTKHLWKWKHHSEKYVTEVEMSA